MTNNEKYLIAINVLTIAIVIITIITTYTT